LTGVEIETIGDVVVERCQTCEKDAPFLKLRKTGQKLELAGVASAKKDARLRVKVGDWKTEHPKLILENSPSPAN